MTDPRTVAAATLILIAGAVLVPAQTRTISGRVIADDTNDPIPNARVSVASAALGAAVVLTDAEGRFALPVASDRSIIVASKTGYARTEVTPAAGAPIEIRLRRAAAITGRVVDQFGDPVPNARVTAETAARSAGASATAAATITDDRGEYRLSGLPAGAFAVGLMRIGAAAMYGQGRQPQKTYYPGGAALTDAETLRVAPGEERPRIDFVVEADPPFLPPLVAVRQQQAVASAAQPSTPAGTGVVRGRVSSVDGRAMAHAHVTLIPALDMTQSRVTTADDGGQFEFRELPAGTYRLGATKTGYAQVVPGDTVDPDTPFAFPQRSVDLIDGTTREGIDLALARWGAITGRVSDELGNPVEGATVQILHVRYEAGRRRLVPAGSGARPTDDLGRYRIFNVPPGHYVVSATAGGVASAELPGYARSYFPGTPNPGDAQFVSIAAAEDVPDIDVSLSRTRTARVAGKVLNAAGEPAMPGALTLAPSLRSSSVVSASVGARILQDGRFEFPNVPPGQYIIRADRGRSRSWMDGEFGTLPVVVDGTDVTDLILQMSAGSTIKGRFTFDLYNNSKMPSPSAFELAPLPVDPDLAPSSPATADIHADWTFDLAGVNGPRRLQLMRAPVGWTLREIRVNGADVTDRALPFGRRDQSLADVEVVVVDRVAELNGTIVDDRSRPMPGAAVIVFSTNADRWFPASRFFRTATAGLDGAFTVAGLPAGGYYAAALSRLPGEGEGAWQDPDFLRSVVSRASSVTLTEGQKAVISLQLPSQNP